MDYRARHKRYQSRKRGAKLAKAARIYGGIVILIGMVLLIGSAGYSDCYGDITIAGKNAFKAIMLIAEGFSIECVAWIIDIITC